MTIKRDVVSEPIYGLTTSTRPRHIYCPTCAMKGLSGADYILGPRVYLLNPGESLPSDADRWLQCRVCGMVIPKHDVPMVGSLTTDVEIIANKFPKVDVEKAEDRPVKDPHKRGFNPRDTRLSSGTIPATVKEPEVIRALRKGAKLISYSET